MRYKSNGCLTGRGVTHLLLQLQDKTESNALQTFLGICTDVAFSLYQYYFTSSPYLKSSPPNFRVVYRKDNAADFSKMKTNVFNTLDKIRAGSSATKGQGIAHGMSALTSKVEEGLGKLKQEAFSFFENL